MSANDYGRFNYTLQECRDGLMRDMAEFGERYTVLAVALTLLDNQETQELVRRWYDLYMQVIDEDSYLRVGNELEELENRIIATASGNK